MKALHLLTCIVLACVPCSALAAKGNKKKGKGDKKAQQAEKVRVARLKGYEGDPCPECGSMTMVRNGTCLKCDSCGSTSGCS